MARKRHILAELAAMPREDVEAELEQVRQEKARLDMEEALLGQVLRIHQFANTGVPGRRTLDGLAASAPEQLERNLSANVLTIVRQVGGHELSPADVQELLADRGVHADLSAIRVALRRWASETRSSRTVTYITLWLATWCLDVMVEPYFVKNGARSPRSKLGSYCVTEAPGRGSSPRPGQPEDPTGIRSMPPDRRSTAYVARKQM